MPNLSDSTFSDLGMGTVSPSLGVYIKLDQPQGQEQTNGEVSPLLSFLQQYHSPILGGVCCIDLTVYEYGTETKPFFHLIAPANTIAAYEESVAALVKLGGTEGDMSYSVALHPKFRTRNSLIPIELPSHGETHGSTNSATALVEKRYLLRGSGPTRCGYPEALEDSLSRFREELLKRQASIRSTEGHVIICLLCCNFTITEGNEDGPFRSLGQLFLGLGESPQVGKSLRPAVSALIRDIGFLLYRGGSAGLLLGAGKDTARRNFSHEAKKLVQLVHDWVVPMDRYFDINSAPGSFTASLRAGNGDLAPSSFGLIPLPEYFASANDIILAWTMADVPSDLPFFDHNVGISGLPSSFRKLFVACYNVALRQCMLSFLRTAGSLHAKLGAIQSLETYLRTKMPELAVAGPAVDHKLNWVSKIFRPRLVDLSRLILVAFREALQHGSWSHEIQVWLGASKDSKGDIILDLKVQNARIGADGERKIFEDAPGTLLLNPEQLAIARSELKVSIPTLSPVDRQGRRQIEFLASYAGGSLAGNINFETAEDDALWTVDCRFPYTPCGTN
jgi:hypothetical protein